MSSSIFKKGDVVMVDERGRAVKYEILSVLAMTTSRRVKDSGERLYEAKNVASGAVRTISQEDVLRRATPVDSSAELFDSGTNE